MRFGKALSTLLENTFAIGSDRALHFFDQPGQGRLCVTRDRQICLRHRLEVLDIAFYEEIERADADTLRICRRRTAALDLEVQNKIDRITLIAGSGKRMTRRDMHTLA